VAEALSRVTALKVSACLLSTRDLGKDAAVWGFLLQLRFDRRAVTALEYGLIAGIIVAVISLGFEILATSLSKSFSSIGHSL
jgi:Flp pilus assembly pilin Flp